MIRNFAAAIALACAACASGAAPVLDCLYPAGGQQGTTVNVQAEGAFNPWPVQAWADASGLRIEPGKTAGTLTIKVDPATAPGPHLVRLYNPQGASMPRVFVVGDAREIAEAEPNDQAAKAQPVGTLPLVINGRLEKSGDVDSYSLGLKQGQLLVASVQGRRLGSPMDPMLQVLDSSGTVLAVAQDGLGLDPLLAWRAPRDGTYLIRIMAFAYPPQADVRLTGGKTDVYRLHLTTGPFIRGAFPASVPRDRKTSVRLWGWNMKPLDRLADATSCTADEDELSLAIPGPQSLLQLSLEAPASSTAAQRPVSLTARLEKPGQEQRIALIAAKGQKFILTARCAALGSAFDPVLRIEDGSGKTLARDDDAGSGGKAGGDARIEWTAPADGTYNAIVGDLDRQGGEDYVFCFEARPPAPGVQASVNVHDVHLVPGSSATIAVTATRSEGFSLPLVALATGLPPGITSTAAPLAQNQATITLSALADAKPFSGPIRVMLVSPDVHHPLARTATFDLAHPEPGQEILPQTPAIWLTLEPSPPPATQPAHR